MGRFGSLLLILFAACGDNNSDPNIGPRPGTGDDNGVNSTDGTSPRYVPAVCGAQTWTAHTRDRDVDLAVAGRPEGAAILEVPKAGGDITGFLLDTRMRMVAGEQKVTVSLPLTEISASFLGDRVTSTGIADGSAYLHMLDDKLENPQLIQKMPAIALSKPAFYNTQADIVMPAGTETGMTLYRFQDSGEPIDSIEIAKSKPVRAMSSVQVGVSLMTAWTTDYECYMTQNSAFAPGKISSLPTACPSPSLAFNKYTGEATLVHESPEGVRAMFMSHVQMDGGGQLLRPNSTSPRALYDGTNMWISYLDARGDVIVGFLDENRHLVSMSLNGPKPFDTSYQLAMIENQPWVIALDDDGYTGHRLCVDAQW